MACKATAPKISPPPPPPPPLTTSNEAYGAFETVIKAQLVKIQPIDRTQTQLSICSQYPCYGYIVVQSILKPGQSYHGQFNPKDTILVHFNFTLAETTKEMFPQITTHYPGITEGLYFEAPIITKNGDGEQLEYEINAYKIIK